MVANMGALTGAVPKFTEIPEEGLPAPKVLDALNTAKKIEEKLWKQGGNTNSGCVYCNNEEHQKLVSTAVSMFTASNPLHSDVFVCTRRMEAEIIRMTANMLHGGPNVCGLMSSGGTESIILATKAYRDRAVAMGKNPNKINIIISDTAHSAYVKAAQLLRMKVHRVPVNVADKTADLATMCSLIDDNTAFMVASAPAYPHGVIDDIPAMAHHCKACGVGVHVDCCLGGFLLPFFKRLGYTNIPPFDFEVDGVTSVSCDTHKYGYGPKGTSVLLFSSSSLREHVIFTDSLWPGGLYASPTLPGSRPGSLIVGTWAAMVFRGITGYTTAAKGIYETAQVIIKGMSAIPNVKFVTNPNKLTFLIPFTTEKVNIFQVAEALQHKGWNLNVLHSPNAIHMCLTEMHIGRGEEFVQALEWAVGAVSAEPEKFMKVSPIYSSAAKLGNRDVVATVLSDVIGAALDTV
eukprot:TRINITY_DN3205_c0_g1_i1.p1 TRINITY_DN3205_c0_g1~~TRINITY_DN3205_c0_g1_i1.p1  ORF type:complete len:540 (-),score=161.44 TRINITY_DN3205_c0_g1_i1:47-1429(-)